jgi:hypothetical protein
MLSRLAIFRDRSWWSSIWRYRRDCIVGTETLPLLSGFVCPLLKLPEGGDGDDVGKTVQQSLKLFQHSHRRLIVSRHTVVLNCLEKGCTNAVRVTIVVLQGLAVILAGLEIVRDNCWAMVGEDAQEDPVQKELGLTMHALAWRRGRRGVRLVGLARGGVVDERPFAAVIFVADDKVEVSEHGQEKSPELQEGMMPVGGPVGVSERGPLGLGREDKGHLVMDGRHFWPCGQVEKEKRIPRTLSRELGELDARRTGRRLGLRWTPVNARDRAGPATLGSHGGGATRGLGVTGP